jgi:Abortive infection alpha
MPRLKPADGSRNPARRRSAYALELGGAEKAGTSEDALPKSLMELALCPITDIAENALGEIGGRWISETRARNRARLRERTEAILNSRGAEMNAAPSPSTTIPLLSAAQDEGREELLDLWARLLATALNPVSAENYRREFVGIARALEPIDVACLPRLEAGATKAWRFRRESMAKALNKSQDGVDLALRNLAKLGLIDLEKMESPDFQSFMTPLGRQFLAAVDGPAH